MQFSPTSVLPEPVFPLSALTSPNSKSARRRPVFKSKDPNNRVKIPIYHFVKNAAAPRLQSPGSQVNLFQRQEPIRLAPIVQSTGEESLLPANLRPLGPEKLMNFARLKTKVSKVKVTLSKSPSEAEIEPKFIVSSAS